MAIIKRTPARYTVICREACETLSADALAVLSYLAGKPDDWEASAKDIAYRFGWGEHKTRNALKELVEHGYARRVAVRDDAGRIHGRRYDIAIEPIFTDSPRLEKSQAWKKPSLEKSPDIQNTESNRIQREEQNTEGAHARHGADAPSCTLDLEEPTPQSKPKRTSRKLRCIDILSTVLSREDAEAVWEHRQQMRKPLTERASELLAREFARVPKSNRTDAVELMIGNSWQGFNADWFAERFSAVPVAPRGQQAKEPEERQGSCSLPRARSGGSVFVIERDHPDAWHQVLAYKRADIDRWNELLRKGARNGGVSESATMAGQVVMLSQDVAREIGIQWEEV